MEEERDANSSRAAVASPSSSTFLSLLLEVAFLNCLHPPLRCLLLLLPHKWAEKKNKKVLKCPLISSPTPHRGDPDVVASNAKLTTSKWWWLSSPRASEWSKVTGEPLLIGSQWHRLHYRMSQNKTDLLTFCPFSFSVRKCKADTINWQGCHFFATSCIQIELLLLLSPRLPPPLLLPPPSPLPSPRWKKRWSLMEKKKQHISFERAGRKKEEQTLFKYLRQDRVITYVLPTT